MSDSSLPSRTFWERMVRAVERVDERSPPRDDGTDSFRQLSLAIIGANAVAHWVSCVDEGASAILQTWTYLSVERIQNRTQAALEAVGFDSRSVTENAQSVFVDGPNG